MKILLIVIKQYIWNRSYCIDTIGNETIQNITINILDIDEEPPIFYNENNFTIIENQPFVLDLNVTDNNSSNILLSITNTDAELFDLNSTTKEITFKNYIPDYENPIDSDKNNIYNFVVVAKDEVGNETNQSINITIQNIDDTPPIFYIQIEIL